MTAISPALQQAITTTYCKAIEKRKRIFINKNYLILPYIHSGLGEEKSYQEWLHSKDKKSNKEQHFEYNSANLPIHFCKTSKHRRDF